MQKILNLIQDSDSTYRDFLGLSEGSDGTCRKKEAQISSLTAFLKVFETCQKRVWHNIVYREGQYAILRQSIYYIAPSRVLNGTKGNFKGEFTSKSFVKNQRTNHDEIILSLMQDAEAQTSVYSDSIIILTNGQCHLPEPFCSKALQHFLHQMGSYPLALVNGIHRYGKLRRMFIDKTACVDKTRPYRTDYCFIYFCNKT